MGVIKCSGVADSSQLSDPPINKFLFLFLSSPLSHHSLHPQTRKSPSYHLRLLTAIRRWLLRHCRNPSVAPPRFPQPGNLLCDRNLMLHFMRNCLSQHAEVLQLFFGKKKGGVKKKKNLVSRACAALSLVSLWCSYWSFGPISGETSRKQRLHTPPSAPLFRPPVIFVVTKTSIKDEPGAIIGNVKGGSILNEAPWPDRSKLTRAHWWTWSRDVCLWENRDQGSFTPVSFQMGGGSSCRKSLQNKRNKKKRFWEVGFLFLFESSKATGIDWWFEDGTHREKRQTPA